MEGSVNDWTRNRPSNRNHYPDSHSDYSRNGLVLSERLNLTKEKTYMKKKNIRSYNVAFINPSTDTFMEIHACGCEHKKPNAEVDKVEYAGDTLDQLQRSVAIEVNHDLAGDKDMSVEEYIDTGEGYEVSRRIGSPVRIMPCVKFGGDYVHSVVEKSLKEKAK